MKRILSFVLSLLLVIGLGPTNASAVQSDVFTISFGTAIYSISEETFIRTVSEPASQAECGEDEFVTLIVNITNNSSEPSTLSNPYVKIDGGKALGWVDFTMQPGESRVLHVYNANPQYLMPGLHTAVFYESNQPLYSGRFGIGRDWSKVMKLPTKEQIAARSSDERSPYMATWLSVGSDVRYDAYCVDFKSDYLPSGTYSSLFNGHMDYSSLKNQYASVDNNDSISLYGGLQRTEEGTNFILSFWDIHCTDAAGNTTIIRPERIYPAEKTDDDSFSHEGTGAHTILPYDWQAGRWYRMLLQCGTSENTGNTTVEQWFQDLTTDEWTHACTYDIGVKDSGFIGDMCFFSENFLKQYAGEVRSLEVANARIHTDEGWQDVVVSTTSGTHLNTGGVHTNAYGSWEAGADENSFYMITTGVSGWGRTENTGVISVKNLESGSPLEENTSKEPVRFVDVTAGAYYYDSMQWAVDKGITSGTSKTTFSPDETCTQAQILTFLWRAKGSPKPTGAMTSSTYYASAVQWAKEQGLVDGTFSADAPCTCAMVVTCLWKLAGSPNAGTSQFTDAAADASYAQAVSWAVGKGVISGTSPTAFSLDSICTRGQIVTFLYQALR